MTYLVVTAHAINHDHSSVHKLAKSQQLLLKDRHVLTVHIDACVIGYVDRRMNDITEEINDESRVEDRSVHVW